MIGVLIWLRTHWKLVAIAATLAGAFMAGWAVNGNRIQAHATSALEKERVLLLATIRAANIRREQEVQAEVERAARINSQLALIERERNDLLDAISTADLSGTVTVRREDSPPIECPDPTASRIFWRIFNGD